MRKNRHQRLTITVEEAGELMGVGRSTAYELARSGDMPIIRLRRRIVVPIARLAEQLGLSVSEILWAVGDIYFDDPKEDVGNVGAPSTLF